MTALDDRLLPTILRIIAKLGRSAKIKDHPFKVGTYSSATGQTTGAIVADCDVTITPLDMNVRQYDPLSEVPKASAVTMIAGDGLAFIPVKGTLLELDVFEDNSTQVWTILKVRAISPGEKVGAYMLFLGA